MIKAKAMETKEDEVNDGHGGVSRTDEMENEWVDEEEVDDRRSFCFILRKPLEMWRTKSTMKLWMMAMHRWHGQ